jgi:hypothetical protein
MGRCDTITGAQVAYPRATRARRSACVLMFAAACLTGSTPGHAQPAAPELVFESLGADEGGRARLGRIDDDQLRSIVHLVGLEAPGDPIRVVLASEETELARATPPWIAGFAHGATDTVVLFPARSFRYPHDSLQAVLHHEIAHILIGRAGGNGTVPRWFNEGLATVAERAWHFEDRRHLAWMLVTRGPLGMDEVDRRFELGASEAAGAYALASAFVRDLIDTHGVDLPARILEGVAAGAGFDEAFRAAAGQPIQMAERQFHARLTSWEQWVPLLTSPFALWTLVTLLALYAIHVRQRRRAERRARWDAEEDEARISAGADGVAAPERYPAAWTHEEELPDDEPPRGAPH